MSAFGARYPTGDVSVSLCPDCGLNPERVWRPGGAFQQRTECKCGRVTVWVMCGHDATAEATDACINHKEGLMPCPVQL